MTKKSLRSNNDQKVLSWFASHNNHKKKVSFSLVKRGFFQFHPGIGQDDLQWIESCLEWLNDLVRKNLIQFPKNSKLYSPLYGSQVPNFIWLSSPDSTSEEKAVERYLSIPWCPDLIFVKDVAITKSTKKLMKQLNWYLIHERGKLNDQLSINERSLEIFGDEKILKDLFTRNWFKSRFSHSDLNCYSPLIPFVSKYFPNASSSNAIIIENLDTFLTFCRVNSQSTPRQYQYVIYGEGLQILQRILWLEYLEPQPTCIEYFGDIDYEGLLIPCQLMEKFEELFPDMQISFAVEYYDALFSQGMMNKSRETRKSLPSTIQVKLTQVFPDHIEKITRILKSRKKIPQENLTITALQPFFQSVIK